MVNKLLVIGTSSIIEQLFKLTLMDSKVDISVTDSHIEAESIIKKNAPDIIFIDPSLKNTNAYEFALSIKKNQKKPVVLLKSSTNWDENAFSSSQADDFLKKPFEPADLFAILKRFNGKGNSTTLTGSTTINVPPIKKSESKPSREEKKEPKPDSKETKSPRSAISLLKKAELENAKDFIKTNLVKRTKNTIGKSSKTAIREALEKENINLSDERLEAKINEIAQEVVERIVWEVVPKLADKIIREELERLTEE